MRKRFLTGFIGIMAFLALTGVTDISAAGIAIVVDTIGNVRVTPQNETERPLTIGMDVSEGDRIETGRGAYVKLIRSDSSIIKINQNTKFAIENTQSGEEKGSVFRVDIGQMFVRLFKERNRAKKFLVKSPTSVTAIRGSEVDILVDRLGTTVVTLISGEAELSNDFGVVPLIRGNRSVVRAPQAQQQATPPTQPVVVNIAQLPRWDESFERGEVPPPPPTEITEEETEEAQPAEEPAQEEEEEAAEEEEPQQEEQADQEAQEEQVEEVVIPEPPAPEMEEASPTIPR